MQHRDIYNILGELYVELEDYNRALAVICDPEETIRINDMIMDIEEEIREIKDSMINNSIENDLLGGYYE